MHRSLQLLSNMAVAMVYAAAIAVVAGIAAFAYTRQIESSVQIAFGAFAIAGLVLCYRAWRANPRERQMFYGRQNARRVQIHWTVPEHTWLLIVQGLGIAVLTVVVLQRFN